MSAHPEFGKRLVTGVVNAEHPGDELGISPVVMLHIASEWVHVPAVTCGEMTHVNVPYQPLKPVGSVPAMPTPSAFSDPPTAPDRRRYLGGSVSAQG